MSEKGWAKANFGSNNQRSHDDTYNLLFFGECQFLELRSWVPQFHWGFPQREHPVGTPSGVLFSATEGTLLGTLAMPWVGLRNLGEVWVSLQISLLSTPQLMQAHSISPFVLKREQLEGAVHFESEITSECAKLVSGYGEDGVRCMAISVSEPIASWQEGDDPAVTCTGGTPLTWQLGI